MIHKSLTDLEYSVQGKFHDCYTKMNNSELLKEMGVEKVAINETLRDLTTQMAYFVRGRMETKYVKMFYAAAGLYEIGDVEAQTVCTNTLRSNHMSGKAVDFVPVKDGKLWWNAPHQIALTLKHRSIYGLQYYLKYGKGIRTYSGNCRSSLRNYACLRIGLDCICN